MNKLSKIKSVNFTSEWKSPAGSSVYYHEIELENGDIGNVGRNKKLPDDMKVGSEIEYSISDKKIKFVKSMNNNESSYKSNNKYYNKGNNNYNNNKGPESYLGYAYAYAKDMVVAGKTSKEDLENLQHIAESIYSHITSLLNKNEDNG